MHRLTVTATFHPQVWINDYAVDIDGPVPFEVSLSADEAKAILAAGDDSYEADTLWHDAPIAPVVDHGGPFYVDAPPWKRL
jgi:hypothetical protein